MKKIILVMVVLMLATPVMAQQTTFSAVAEGDGVVAIYYDATAEAERPRAFALDFIVTDGNVLDEEPVPGGNILDVYDVNEHFNIYPGTIEIIDGDVNDYGTPVAPNDFPGTQPGIGTPGVTIELGSLYEGEANAPPRSGLLCRVEVAPSGASDKLYVHANVVRALTGVVLEDASSSPTNVQDSLWCYIFPRFLQGDCSSSPLPPPMGNFGMPDGVVDGYDQNKVIAHWTADAKPYSPEADLSSSPLPPPMGNFGMPDGVVDGYDQNKIIANWD